MSAVPVVRGIAARRWCWVLCVTALHRTCRDRLSRRSMPGVELQFPARRGRASRLPHRVVVRDGLGAGRGSGRAARLPGDVLPRAAGARRIEPEPLRAAAGAVRARGGRGTGARQAAARRALGARGIRSRVRARGLDATSGSTTGRCGSEDGRYRTVVRGDDFEFELDARARRSRRCCRATAASAARARPRAASYYYSLPQLRGERRDHDRWTRRTVTGKAWFDHEWSSDYVDDHARGWDWLGVNLDDGGALMAFRMRGPQGGARWAAATHCVRLSRRTSSGSCRHSRRRKSRGRRCGAGVTAHRRGVPGSLAGAGRRSELSRSSR